MSKYWVGVASREHVLVGVQEGICQVCHGKVGPLKRMKEGDWIVYYSPTFQFGVKNPCRRFTAIGEIQAGEPYPYKMSNSFIPWRRDVQFVDTNETEIEPLIEHLSFLPNKKSWGFPFRRGCFEIPEQDFNTIRKAMTIQS